MTRGTGERLYRACQRCRKRKSKCDLNSVGAHGRPPCMDCFRTGHDCTLAGSRRGGNYSHFRKRKNRIDQHEERLTHRSPSIRASPPSIADTVNAKAFGRDERDDETICVELKNPFDALQILAKAAVNDNRLSDHNNYSLGPDKLPLDPSGDRHDLGDDTIHRTNPGQTSVQTGYENEGIRGYELVANGALDVDGISELLRSYEENYHAFIPLVPKHVLTPVTLDQSTADERFLLTAILTIASKDNPSLAVIHRNCWEYMKKLLLDVLLGLPSTQRIGSVEGLLLLSEWAPYFAVETPLSQGIQQTFCGPEDSASWSLVGQAVRQAYLLRLDRTSFRKETLHEPKDLIDRKRLVWTFVYLADRQISVRMGQSFWSRGPSLSTKFTAADFPTLQPKSSAEDDYASILQATIELTQLLHNVHDILYTSKSRTLEIMFMGDYSRYLDDFLKALAAWNLAWGPLDVSPKLKCTLRLMYEYLCLYVNAFSLQAVISRSSDSQRRDDIEAQSLFPGGVMASPDGRFIFEAIRSAKVILKLFPEMDAVTNFRYLPSRFYLYGIYSAVFLYRAGIFGALNITDEQEEVVDIVRGFMAALENSASSYHHIGQRYSTLLKNLWFPGLEQTSANNQTIQMKTYGSAKSTTNTGLNTPKVSQSIDPEPQVPMLETMSFDPFYGSFSGFEADVFGFTSQDIFGVQGLD